MGDRSGLTRLDRTNGFDDGRDYMRVKKSKLAQQNDQIRDALRNRNNSSKTDIFKGISINVNGRTQPTADELKRLILLNGGEYHPYYRYQTTKFMIATNLSMARMKQLRPDDRVVRPEWITESIEAKCLLPYEDYQLFVEEPRGKNGSVLGVEQHDMLTAGSSSDLIPVTESYSRSYRNNKKSKQNHPETKSKDIREMFKKAVRSIDNGDIGGKKRGAASQNSSSASETDHSRDGISQPRKQNSSSTFSNGAQYHHQQQQQQKQQSINKKKNIILDYLNKSKNSNCFPMSTVSEEKYAANICGLANLDDVIRLLTEWVGCPEGITDEQTACVTKYFYDLMSERNYHNKFYEIILALQQKVIEEDDSIWICLYNNLVSTLKDELNRQSEASQNLNQLITLIDTPGEEEEPSQRGSQEKFAISLSPIEEDDFD